MKPAKRRWATLRFRKKIRNALLAYYLTPILLMLVLAGFFFYFFAKESLDDELGKRLESVALAASYQIYPFQVPALELRDPENLTYRALLSRLEQIRGDNQMARIYVFTPKNESLLDTDRSVSIGSFYERNRANRVELEHATRGTPAASVLFQGADGNYYKSAFAPVRGPSGSGSALVGVDGSATFFSNLHALSRGLALFGFFCVAVIIAVTVIIARKIVLPVQLLVAAAERIGGGHFERPVELRSQNEIGFLGLVMDEMRKRILSRDRELQTMLRGIAHEVRNPLGGIELYAGMLAEEVEDPQSRKAVERIQREVRILKNLVEEFLDFARKPAMSVTAVPLEPFLGDLRAAFQTEMRTRRVDFVIEATGVSEAEFDPDQMRRVFLNLVRNSIQAVPDGGKIRVRAARADGNIEFSVEDDGAGIQPENLEKVFDPFFTTKEGGSGLGLSFASKIVTAHGGEMRIESRPGGGTTVVVVLPA